MNKVNTSTGGSGIGVLGLVGFVLVGLRAFGLIEWSWWWVTAPFWGVVLLVLLILAVVDIYRFVSSLLSMRQPEPASDQAAVMPMSTPPRDGMVRPASKAATNGRRPWRH